MKFHEIPPAKFAMETGSPNGEKSPRLCRIFVESGDVEGCVTLVDLAGSEHRIVPRPLRKDVGRWDGGWGLGGWR